METFYTNCAQALKTAGRQDEAKGVLDQIREQAANLE